MVPPVEWSNHVSESGDVADKVSWPGPQLCEFVTTGLAGKEFIVAMAGTALL